MEIPLTPILLLLYLLFLYLCFSGPRVSIWKVELITFVKLLTLHPVIALPHTGLISSERDMVRVNLTHHVMYNFSVYRDSFKHCLLTLFRKSSNFRVDFPETAFIGLWRCLLTKEPRVLHCRLCNEHSSRALFLTALPPRAIISKTSMSVRMMDMASSLLFFISRATVRGMNNLEW